MYLFVLRPNTVVCFFEVFVKNTQSTDFCNEGSRSSIAQSITFAHVVMIEIGKRMEVWQKDHIINNFDKLVELTSCNELFLAKLYPVLSKCDVESLVSKRLISVRRSI